MSQSHHFQDCSSDGELNTILNSIVVIKEHTRAIGEELTEQEEYVYMHLTDGRLLDSIGSNIEKTQSKIGTATSRIKHTYDYITGITALFYVK